jgi:hypothetical protein
VRRQPIASGRFLLLTGLLVSDILNGVTVMYDAAPSEGARTSTVSHMEGGD